VPAGVELGSNPGRSRPIGHPGCYLSKKRAAADRVIAAAVTEVSDGEPIAARQQGAKRLIERLDRVSGDLNAVLLTLAIGLAVLDLTCFFAFEIRDALPSVARADASLAAKPQPVAQQSLAA
jgi:hypothetical protein